MPTSFMARPGKIQQRWYLIDSTDQIVGRLAVQIANILRGKHRPEYTPHIDTGEFVIVITPENVRSTSQKLLTNKYEWYTAYPGALQSVPAREWLEKHPYRSLLQAVK